MPGHFPGFSHLLAKKETRSIVQHLFSTRQSGERGTLAAYNSKINTISCACLSSRASNGENSETNNRNKWGAKWGKMLSWPWNMVLQKQPLIQEDTNFWLTESRRPPSEHWTQQRQDTGPLLWFSMGGTLLSGFLSCCEFVLGECCQIWGGKYGYSPSETLVGHAFSPNKGLWETYVGKDLKWGCGIRTC